MVSRILKIVIVALIVVSNVSSYGQSITLTQGSTQSLSKEGKVSIQFTYDERLLELVKDKSYWLNNGRETYEAVFREMFTKYCKIETVESNGKHVVLVHVTNLDPGTAPEKSANRIAYMNSTVKIVEPDKLDSPLAVFELKDIQGRKSNFGGGFSWEGGANYNASAGGRIMESYAKSGKMLGGFIAKNSKK